MKPTLTASTLVLCIVLPLLCPAQEQIVQDAQRRLEYAQRELKQARQEAVSAPAQLQAQYTHRVSLLEGVVEYGQKALEVAKSGQRDAYYKARQRADLYRRVSSEIQSWIGMREDLRRYTTETNPAPGEKARLQKMEDLLTAMWTGLESLATTDVGRAPQADVDKAFNDVYTKRREFHASREVLQAYEVKRRLLQRKENEKDDVLRARYAEAEQLHDRMIALMEEIAAANDSRRQQELSKQRQALWRELRMWDAAQRAAQQARRDEEQLAKAPLELKNLAAEIKELRENASRIEIDLQREGLSEMEEIRLRAAIEALERRSEILEELYRAREQTLDVMRAARKPGQDPLVVHLGALGERALLDFEDNMRDLADLATEAIELEARVEMRQEELEQRGEQVEGVIEFLEEMAEETADAMEDLDERMSAEGLRDLREELVEDYAEGIQELKKQPGGAQTAVAVVEALYNDMLAQVKSAEAGLAGLSREDRGRKLLAITRKGMLLEGLAEMIEDLARMEKDVRAVEAPAQREALLGQLSELYKQMTEAASQASRTLALVDQDAPSEQILDAMQKAYQAGSRIMVLSEAIKNATR